MPYASPFQGTTAQHGRREGGHSSLSGNHPADASSAYFHNASGERISTDVYMYNAIKRAHPDVHVIDSNAFNANIPTYVFATGDGSVEVLDSGINIQESAFEDLTKEQKHAFATSINHIEYIPPVRRLDGGNGILGIDVVFGKFLVRWGGMEFLIYISDGRDGTAPYTVKRQYIVTSDPSAALSLLKTAGAWANTLHGEIWVFDQGFWQKDAGLWNSIQKSNWEDIILPADLKEDLLENVQRFYNSRDTYRQLHVAWKRGMIFYGPPGNGKTVSIKATMKTLYDREIPVPTLYVKSLVSFAGSQYSINAIFTKARREAPCYLVFEDLDSMITDQTRSFFLNAVDGLSENEGILMIGSTNHLEKLDPGIAKRPSRFDRKYLFPDPDLEQRIKYCRYWQKKLEDNKDVEFPDLLLRPIARKTDGFSFAYIQEAFVSTLLKLASNPDRSGGPEDRNVNTFSSDMDEEELVLIEQEDALTSERKSAAAVYDYRATGNEDDLDKYLLWREIKVQIANLRQELDRGVDQIV
ncbi:hypothetical protein LTR64_003196 [Lithohypha guttulata]|uniref:uncharacterized protein n=1 Tax=Lithohypha guttulata TaxID=1690604 RepID=UPI002DDFFC1B|nr:hypothetical protein LTR51_000582 [Lithohypha guttulata]